MVLSKESQTQEKVSTLDGILLDTSGLAATREYYVALMYPRISVAKPVLCTMQKIHVSEY